METRIAENIRAYRKQRGLTQEQLAEVLGVSVGAVYKWESRSSLPELRLIMEMADFFDVSVDALLGYRMKDNQLNATVERLWKASGSRDYGAVSEAEKAVRKYPHSFDAVYAAAFLYYAFAAETKKEPWLRRAIELMDSARLLVAQCPDPRVNESVLYGRMAEMYELLGETDKANGLFYKLINYGKNHLFDEVRMDYFAVSLPDLLVWNDSLTNKNRLHCYYLLALGHYGLGNREKAAEYLSEAEKLDCNHSGLQSLRTLI